MSAAPDPILGLTPSPDAQTLSCRNAVAQVLGSAAFASSAKLSAFLRFICDEALSGRGDRLNEQLIGLAVFGRPESFNPAEDSIVRSNARLLRQRLGRYYDEEGRADAMRIVVPRGSYVPVFAEASEGMMQAASPDPASLQPLPVLPPQAAEVGSVLSRSRRHALWVLGGLGGASVVAGLAYATMQHKPSDPAEAMWHSLLAADRDFLLVPADSGLVIWQNEHHRELALEEYLREWRPDAGSGADAGARRYTGVVSMRLAVEMTRRAGPAASRVRVRFARDLHLNELKEANAVLIGAGNSNPWVQLFREQCAFGIDMDAERGFVVVNRSPGAGESERYTYRPGAGGPSYAHVAFKPNLGGHGQVLILGGTGSAGTDAAIDFLLDPVALLASLRKINPTGVPTRNFEILLQAKTHGSGGVGHNVLAARFWPLA